MSPNEERSASQARRTRARRLVALLSGMVITAAIMVSTTSALHTSTVRGFYHGIGDGANDNRYIHLFNQLPEDSVQCSNIRMFKWKPNEDEYEFIRGKAGCKNHLHFNHRPKRECRFTSIHSFVLLTTPQNRFHHEHCRD